MVPEAVAPTLPERLADLDRRLTRAERLARECVECGGMVQHFP